MRSYKRIMVATDFSPVSEIASEEAVALASHYGAALSFVHVIEHFPEHLPHYRIAHEEMDPQHFIINRAEEDLAKLCERLGVPDAERAVRLTTHSAKVEIVHVAQESKVDLLVMGARGRRTLLDVLSGSTATGVVRAASCDVFVIHEREQQD